MSEESQNCPKCQSPHSYLDRNIWICPECFHEWSVETATEREEAETDANAGFLDANGVELNNGDTVAVIKDLKVGNDKIKSGTKVKGIRLLDDPVDGHDISCKIPGHGSVYLKCSVVKKLK